jgi:PAS domain S-box-containing protein
MDNNYQNQQSGKEHIPDFYTKSQIAAIIDNPMLGIAWGNADGYLTNANKAFCAMMEGPLLDLVGRHPVEFTHSEDLPYTIPPFKKMQEGILNNYRVEKRYTTLKGNIIWVEVNVSCERDAKGNISMILGVVQDISVQKRAQEALLKSQANMRYILDNSDTGCLLLDKELKILSANRLANEWAFSEMGITLNDGEEFLIHFPEKYKSLAEPVLQKVSQGTPFSYEAKYTKQNNETHWYHVRLAPISEKGEVFGLIIVATDTTGRKTAEAEIKSLNDSLEKKVKDRTRELEEANKELEAFTYSVSHDLLSPLRNIDSFIDILIEDYRNKLNDDGQYTLSVIKRNSTLMSRLIEDLLNFARFAKAPLRKQMVNMNSTVNEVIDELRFMTNKLAAKIDLQDMHPAYCDPQLIKQVWVNLISNAIKYSKTKEKPEIEIGSMEAKGQIVYFIKDNGIGFDMRDADKLFGVFQRLHRTSDFEGTGVGLAIVHRIITKHGGNIWAESKPNEGTAFYFTL